MMGAYARPQIRLMLHATQQLSKDINSIRRKFGLNFSSDQGNVNLLINFNIPEEQIDDLSGSAVETHENTMELRVKKPDFLGDSKWEFRQEFRQYIEF